MADDVVNCSCTRLRASQSTRCWYHTSILSTLTPSLSRVSPSDKKVSNLRSKSSSSSAVILRFKVFLRVITRLTSVVTLTICWGDFVGESVGRSVIVGDDVVGIYDGSGVA